MPVRPATSAMAALRVYEPLAAYAGQERGQWEAYARSGRGADREATTARERAAALSALAGRLPALPDPVAEAWTAEVDGVTLVCPWRLRERSAQALADFRDPLPQEVADAFVPRPVADAAADELADALEAAQTTGGGLRLPVLVSTWQVPLAWFVLVDAEERTVELGTVAQGRGAATGQRTGRALVYRTPMSRARRRVARALAVLRRALPDADAVEAVEDLGRWLEDFHPRSLVELDYGGLVHLLDDAELQQDRSARDVAEALAALADGDADRSLAAYGRVTSRMKALQAVESAN